MRVARGPWRSGSDGLGFDSLRHGPRSHLCDCCVELDRNLAETCCFRSLPCMERFSAAKLLGSGSSGCVLAVTDGGRTKAMKVRNADLARGTNVDSDAMANEGTVIAKMNHRSIVRSLGELRAPLTDAMLSLLPSADDKVNARIHTLRARTRTWTHSHDYTHRFTIRPHLWRRTHGCRARC